MPDSPDSTDFKNDRVSRPGVSRREVFRTSLTALGGAAGLFFSRGALAAACGLTPRQVQGPFYPVPPVLHQPDKDADLTYVQGKPGKAAGQVIFIQGVITDDDCQPVPGALVEIWQACHTGRYNHPSDPNPAELDPNFQYWGRAVTDASGRYSFKTILPGAYPASADWMRPPHIHYKIAARGYHELITQLYFAGQPYNEQDRILRAVPAAERSKVITRLSPLPPGPDVEPGAQLGRFDISLRKVV